MLSLLLFVHIKIYIHIYLREYSSIEFLYIAYVLHLFLFSFTSFSTYGDKIISNNEQQYQNTLPHIHSKGTHIVCYHPCLVVKMGTHFHSNSPSKPSNAHVHSLKCQHANAGHVSSRGSQVVVVCTQGCSNEPRVD